MKVNVKVAGLWDSVETEVGLPWKWFCTLSTRLVRLAGARRTPQTLGDTVRHLPATAIAAPAVPLPLPLHLTSPPHHLRHCGSWRWSHVRHLLDTAAISQHPGARGLLSRRPTPPPRLLVARSRGRRLCPQGPRCLHRRRCRRGHQRPPQHALMAASTAGTHSTPTPTGADDAATTTLQMREKARSGASTAPRRHRQMMPPPPPSAQVPELGRALPSLPPPS